ncbi:MAG: helix-turn-helix transcriptional regulator [Bryobacteraceae bacterium]
MNSKKASKPAPQLGPPATEDGSLDLLDYEQLAKVTRKSIVTLRRYKMLGLGPRPLIIGRQVRFMRRDVLAWLESCASTGTEAR